MEFWVHAYKTEFNPSLIFFLLIESFGIRGPNNFSPPEELEALYCPCVEPLRSSCATSPSCPEDPKWWGPKALGTPCSAWERSDDWRSANCPGFLFCGCCLKSVICFYRIGTSDIINIVHAPVLWCCHCLHRRIKIYVDNMLGMQSCRHIS